MYSGFCIAGVTMKLVIGVSRTASHGASHPLVSRRQVYRKVVFPHEIFRQSVRRIYPEMAHNSPQERAERSQTCRNSSTGNEIF
ncbi:hypothetical protein EUGRSUZ_L03142 [Eucalyptus grandis]|uniref:Uncharacterized protein n=1 Tax=Eucalyptus grandis TaxID=71139 RepID=A0AAD9T8A8_EUCGR|nr:hypothetical protein EUGRSUZ_L03142 [Eucalyptus grandis]